MRLPSKSRAQICVSMERGARQRGVVTIEFAFVFPALFIIFYAIVTYGLIFAAQQALTLAAAEGARAGLRYQASDPDMVLRRAAAEAAARAPLNWLDAMGGPTANPKPLTITPTIANCTYNAALRCVTVAISYNYAAHPLVPSLPLLPTPAALNSRAVAQVSLSTL